MGVDCICSFTDAMVTGTAYLLYASDNNQNFKISRLDANYYNVTGVASQLNGELVISICHRTSCHWNSI